MIFNNKIGINISDGTITLCDTHHHIISGPFCKILQDNGPNRDNACTYSLYYPFQGSVVVDFQVCKTIFRQYAKTILPKIHVRTSAYLSVSPVSGWTELKEISNLYKFHHTYLSYEPIAFLHGIHKEDGIVISINRTMLEISVVENLTIKKYEWTYIRDYRHKGYSTINQTIEEILKKLDINKYCDKDKMKYYIIGEREMIHNFIQYNINFPYFSKFEIYSNSSKIIVENIFDAPRLQF